LFLKTKQASWRRVALTLLRSTGLKSNTHKEVIMLGKYVVLMYLSCK